MCQYKTLLECNLCESLPVFSYRTDWFVHSMECQMILTFLKVITYLKLLGPFVVYLTVATTLVSHSKHSCILVCEFYCYNTLFAAQKSVIARPIEAKTSERLITSPIRQKGHSLHCKVPVAVSTLHPLCWCSTPYLLTVNTGMCVWQAWHGGPMWYIPRTLSRHPTLTSMPIFNYSVVNMLTAFIAYAVSQ